MTFTVDEKRASALAHRTTILACLALAWVVVGALGMLWALAPSVSLFGDGVHTAEEVATMRRAMLVLAVMGAAAGVGTALAGVWRLRRWLSAFAVLLVATAALAWSLLGDGCQNALRTPGVTAAQACWEVLDL